MIYLQEPPGFNTAMHVAGCYLDYLDSFLLLQRQKGKPQEMKWGIPAGKVIEPLDGVIREVREETNIQLDPNKLVYLGKLYVQQDVNFIFHAYYARLMDKPKVVLQGDEHHNFKWAPKEYLLEYDLVEDERYCITYFLGVK